jgi:hypothetical protein
MGGQSAELWVNIYILFIRIKYVHCLLELNVVWVKKSERARFVLVERQIFLTPLHHANKFVGLSNIFGPAASSSSSSDQHRCRAAPADTLAHLKKLFVVVPFLFCCRNSYTHPLSPHSYVPLPRTTCAVPPRWKAPCMTRTRSNE